MGSDGNVQIQYLALPDPPGLFPRHEGACGTGPRLGGGVHLLRRRWSASHGWFGGS
jgi:hypothetical protein